MAGIKKQVADWYMNRLGVFWDERLRAHQTQPDVDSAALYPTETELSPVAEQPDRSTWPAEVAAAHAHYKAHVEDQDWGTVRVYRVPTDGPLTYAVRVRTDGDDGYLEVYGEDGGFLVAGRTEVGSVAWCSRDGLRAQVGQSYAPDLEWDKPFAEE